MPSPVASPRPAPHDVGRARWAATLAFATNGALLGALVPHYPQAKAAFGLDAGAFGLLVIALALGAAATGSLAAPVLRRAGSRRVVLVGTAGLAVLTAAAGVVLDVADAAPGAPWAGAVGVFGGLLLVAGAGDAIVDTAQNAQGLRVQTLLARPVLTSMHAGWSLGAALGAGLGALSAGAGLPAGVHLALNGTACLGLLLAVHRRFLPDADATSTSASTSPSAPASPEAATARHDGAAPRPSRARAWTALAPVALIAMAGFGVEEFGNAWTALYLQSDRGLDPAPAGLGAAALLGAQFLGRLAGDRVLHVLGRRRTLRASLVVVVAGLGLALAAPSLPAVFAGLALAGLGCAVVVPTAYALGDEIPGLPAQTGLAVVSWLMRLAGIGLSPLVGLLATGVPLPAALLAFPVLAALGLACTLLIDRPARPRPGAPTPAAR